MRLLAAIFLIAGLLFVPAHAATARPFNTFSCDDNVALGSGGYWWNDARSTHQVFEQGVEYGYYRFCHDLSTGDYVFISQENNEYTQVALDGNLYATDVNHDVYAEYKLTCTAMDKFVLSSVGYNQWIGQEPDGLTTFRVQLDSTAGVFWAWTGYGYACQ